MILALIAAVVVLVLTRGCGRDSVPVDVQIDSDSIERVIKSKIPEADTVFVEGEQVVKWLPSATIRDTVYMEGKEIPVYMVGEVDTNAILSHYLTQAVVYVDTIRDSSLQAIIQDTIFRNKITARKFSYKILRPTKMVTYKPDRFQMIVSFQAGGGMSYQNKPTSIYAGVDVGLKFKTGTYFSIGYMAGSGHFGTIRAGQVIRFKKPKLSIL